MTRSGVFLDLQFELLYNELGGVDNCEEWNSACYKMRAGVHNW